MSKQSTTIAFHDAAVPINWEVKELHSCSEFITKGSTPTTYGFSWVTEGVVFLRSECVSERGLELGAAMFITEEADKVMRRSSIEADDILITITGNVGRVCQIPKNFPKANINQHIARIRIKNVLFNRDFIFQYLKQDKIQKEYLKITTGQAYPQLSLVQVRNTQIPLPPLPEQKAIAQVLITADAAIQTTEKLIAQKEIRKNWLMQQLLTGKKRLKGFGVEWKEFKLGKLIEICSSKRVLEEDWKTVGIPFYRTREIIKLSKDEELRSPIFITESLFEELKTKYGVPKANDILVTGVGTIGETYIVKAEDKFYFKDGNVIWFKMNEKINSSFLSQLFKTVYVRKQLLDNASITTVATFTIEGAKNTKIKLPSIEEQTAIAQVLQAADKEINLLKTKVEKLREQKKGLMQVLLTGKVRLKID